MTSQNPGVTIYQVVEEYPVTLPDGTLGVAHSNPLGENYPGFFSQEAAESFIAKLQAQEPDSKFFIQPIEAEPI